MPLGDYETVSDTTEDDAASDVTASDATGALEEGERFRRLFTAFDANQDGFLDKSDLERMCRQLQLDEQAVPLILSQLGADHHGQVSCDDFIQAWLDLRAEVERLQRPSTAEPPPTPGEHELYQTAADRDGHGDCVSWSSGVTSGDPADPALQADSLFTLLERAGISVTEPSDLLIAADKVHQSTVSALRAELTVTSARLGQVTEENGHLQRTLNKALRDRSRLEREAAGRLEQTVERYEERLVELHSVIAELSRKLQLQRATAIAEEDERDLEDAEEPETAPEREQLELELGEKPEQEQGDEQEPGAHPEDEQEPEEDESPAEGEPTWAEVGAGAGADKACQMTDTSASEEPDGAAAPPLSPTGADRAAASPALVSPPPPRLELMEEKIYSLMKENGRLQDQVGRQEAEINRCRIGTESATEERDRLRRKLVEYQRLVESGGSPARAGPAQTADLSSPVVPRMAERVRLRQSSSGVTGSDISACGIQSTRVAEQLVQCYQGESAAAEALHCSGRSLQDRLLLSELETDRLRARLEHALAQADVLGLTLEAACAQSDHLAALCGKYESNCVALQLAAEAGDQLTEAFDLLVALQESELTLLLASCRAAGLGLTGPRPPPADSETALRVATEQRRSCENVARHALSRLERRATAAGASEDGSQNTSTTSSSSSGVDVEVARSEESRLRQHIQRLKVERALVSRTVVRLESTCHAPPTPRPLTPAQAQRLDLEHAVLMQELMALREDRAELRSRLFLLEREKTGLELQLSSRAASDQAQRLQLQQLRAELGRTEDDTEALSVEPADAVDGGRPGSPSARYKLRQLSASLDEVTRASELRQQHADQFIAELKRANGALAEALEKTKRKYQAKLKRLEQQMLQIVERHSSQLRGVKQRPALDRDLTLPSEPGPAGAAPSPAAAAAVVATAVPALASRPAASPVPRPGASPVPRPATPAGQAAASRLPVMTSPGRRPVPAAASPGRPGRLAASSPTTSAASPASSLSRAPGGSPAAARTPSPAVPARPATAPKRQAPAPPPLSARPPAAGQP